MILAGTTSHIDQIFVTDDAGDPKTLLTFETAGLSACYFRNTGSGEAAITLVDMTLGTWTSGGFKEVDATNSPGIYAIGVPNAAIAAGANNVTIQFKGVADCVFTPLKIDIQESSDVNVHIWHVAKTGLDANSGHAFNTAKLTVQAAVTAAAAGDKIIVWPGTYDEQVTVTNKDYLTLEGAVGWGAIISKSTTGVVLSLDDGSRVRKLQIINTGTPTVVGHCVGIKSAGKSNCVIDDCYVSSTGRAIYADNANNFRVNNVIAIGAECGVILYNSTGADYRTILRNSFISTDGWTIGDSTGVYCYQGITLIDGCTIKGYVPETAIASSSTGLALHGNSATRVNINNSCIEASSYSSSYERGIYSGSGAGKADVLANDCYIRTTGTSYSYDLMQAGTGSLVVNNCKYDTARTSGTITDAAAVVSEDIEALAAAIGNDPNLGIAYDYEVLDSVGAPIADVLVEAKQSGVLIQSARTGTDGNAHFYLSAGAYDFYSTKSGYTFTNPDTETIA